MAARKALLLDLEGTTTSISFVKDTLFPFATENVEKFLTTSWDNESVQAAVEGMREQAIKDVESKLEGAVSIPKKDSPKEEQIDAVSKSLKWLISIDNKGTYMKQLSGLIWETGYKDGQLKGHLYDDVKPAIQLWKEDGRKVYIYSSGSVHAQKLLLKYSTSGDLELLIDDYFDTTVGNKREASSYKNILEKTNLKAEEMTFLTDIFEEAEAATQAGLNAILLAREGNAPLSEEIKEKYSVIKSFSEVDQTMSLKRKPAEEEGLPPAKIPKTDSETCAVEDGVDKKENSANIPETTNDEKMEVDEEVNKNSEKVVESKVCEQITKDSEECTPALDTDVKMNDEPEKKVENGNDLNPSSPKDLEKEKTTLCSNQKENTETEMKSGEPNKTEKNLKDCDKEDQVPLEMETETSNGLGEAISENITTTESKIDKKEDSITEKTEPELEKDESKENNLPEESKPLPDNVDKAAIEVEKLPEKITEVENLVESTNQINDKSSIDEANDKPSTVEVKDEPTMNEIKDKPLMEEVKETNEVNEKPSTNEVNEKPSTNEVNDKPSTNEVNDKPLTEEIKSKPTEEAMDEPLLEEAKDKKSVDDKINESEKTEPISTSVVSSTEDQPEAVSTPMDTEDKCASTDSTEVNMDQNDLPVDAEVSTTNNDVDEEKLNKMLGEEGEALEKECEEILSKVEKITNIDLSAPNKIMRKATEEKMDVLDDIPVVEESGLSPDIETNNDKISAEVLVDTVTSETLNEILPELPTVNDKDPSDIKPTSDVAPSVASVDETKNDTNMDTSETLKDPVEAASDNKESNNIEKVNVAAENSKSETVCDVNGDDTKEISNGKIGHELNGENSDSKTDSKELNGTPAELKKDELTSKEEGPEVENGKNTNGAAPDSVKTIENNEQAEIKVKKISTEETPPEKPIEQAVET